MVDAAGVEVVQGEDKGGGGEREEAAVLAGWVSGDVTVWGREGVDVQGTRVRDLGSRFGRGHGGDYGAILGRDIMVADGTCAFFNVEGREDLGVRGGHIGGRYGDEEKTRTRFRTLFISLDVVLEVLLGEWW